MSNEEKALLEKVAENTGRLAQILERMQSGKKQPARKRKETPRQAAIRKLTESTLRNLNA